MLLDRGGPREVAAPAQPHRSLRRRGRMRAVPLTITLQPSATLWSSASNSTLLLIAALTSFVPSAVRNNKVRC